LFGVSPAYFISRFGPGFSVSDISNSLDDLAELGFEAFELEVFYPERLEDWVRKGASELARSTAASGLTVSQFVGHFLLNYFGDGDILGGDAGVPEFRKVVDSLEHFPGCRTVTLPIPAVTLPAATAAAGSGGSALGSDLYRSLYDATVAKIEKMLAIAAENQVYLGLEILPYSVIGGSEGLLRLIDRLDSPWLGYNFDTGHAWAMKERIELLPEKLAGRIFGTHLCDNDAGVNNSWTPGEGTIDWSAVMAALRSSGYHSSLDIEIHCPADQVAQHYRRGRDYLAALTGAADS
jgi:sugar phosphate isomerase/epimerase